MSAKLFVGALPFDYSDADLRALLDGYGKVLSATMVPDPDRGRTRGFGFVEMSSVEDAKKAIEELNGKLVGEKNVYVTVAREKAPLAPAPKFEARPGNYPPRKSGRPGPADYPQDRAWRNRPPRPEQSSDPRRPAGRPYGRSGPGSGRPGRPFDPASPRAPGSFGASRGRTGFSKPGKWEPRGTGAHSFGAPRRDRGGFGAAGRPALSSSPEGRPAGPGSARTPGSFAPSRGRTGFSKPGKWEPRDTGAKSFGKPRRERGDFAPRRSPSDGPVKKTFWQKFDKKKPKPA